MEDDVRRDLLHLKVLQSIAYTPLLKAQRLRLTCCQNKPWMSSKTNTRWEKIEDDVQKNLLHLKIRTGRTKQGTEVNGEQ